MSSPVRWLEENGAAPPGATELLSVAAPPPELTRAVRERLAAGIAKTATLPLPSPSTSWLAKSAFVAVVGGASGLLLEASPDHGREAEPARVLATPPSRIPNDASSPAATVETQPLLELPKAPAAPSPSQLKHDPRLAEAELLERARALLASNPAAALKLTVAHSREYRAGRLGAEADLIAAQALLGMGKLAEAKQRARASLTRYPSGLYARQLRDIVAQ